MATHRLAPTTYHNVLGTRPPALAVASGDTVIAPPDAPASTTTSAPPRPTR